MNLLPKVQGKQPLRTVGELRQFIADLDDSVLLASFCQYGDDEIFPVVAEVCEDVRGEDGMGKPPSCWMDHKHLYIHGYEQYLGDPVLEFMWEELPPPADNTQSVRYYIPAEEGPGQKEYGAPILRFVEQDGDKYWYGEFLEPEADADLSNSPGVVYSKVKKQRICKELYEYLVKHHVPEGEKP